KSDILIGKSQSMYDSDIALRKELRLNKMESEGSSNASIISMATRHLGQSIPGYVFGMGCKPDEPAWNLSLPANCTDHIEPPRIMPNEFFRELLEAGAIHCVVGDTWEYPTLHHYKKLRLR